MKFKETLLKKVTKLESRKAELKAKIEEDQYLKYIVSAIKYAAGENV